MRGPRASRPRVFRNAVRAGRPRSDLSAQSRWHWANAQRLIFSQSLMSLRDSLNDEKVIMSFDMDVLCEAAVHTGQRGNLCNSIKRMPPLWGLGGIMRLLAVSPRFFFGAAAASESRPWGARLTDPFVVCYAHEFGLPFLPPFGGVQNCTRRAVCPSLWPNN